MRSQEKASIPTEQTRAKNTIFMIVDGMGFEHVKAARVYNGMKPLAYEKFTCKTKVTTCSFAGADKEGHCTPGTSDVTDSAAAATAIATGRKVGNGVISRDLPTHSEDVETILERAKKQDKSVGVIATKLFTDATPAAFVSHANDRGMTEEILKDMFHDVKPNIVFGADTDVHRRIAKESKQPYHMVHTAKDLLALSNEIASGPSCAGAACSFVYGGFGEHAMIPGVFKNVAGLPLEITPSAQFEKMGVPHLSEMTDAALKILSKNERGFFLMVESSMPDMISHESPQIDALPKGPKAIDVLVHEMLEVENTVRVLENFVAKHPDTLVIVTADHETGGLTLEMDKTACLGKETCVPEVKWTSPQYTPTPDSDRKHTNADVPLYALGRGAEKFCTEAINNTDIAAMAMGR